MARQLLGAVVLGLALSACSSQPLGEDTQSATSEAAAGSVSLPLVTTTPDKVSYRLRLAKFTIAGPALGGRARVITPLADVEVHNESLPTGNYSVTLEKGWVLERRGPEDAAYAAITASLVTPNPMELEITGLQAAEALFGFVTTSGEVSLGNGSVNVRIGVQTCDVFDSYMASLGTLTAACLGTVDPRAYSLNADGYLTPKFDKCTTGDELALRSINQVLSLQYMSASLPTGKACLAGRYSTALAKFLASDIKVCPTLKFVQTENPITKEVIEKVTPMLPELPSTEPLPPGILDGDRPMLKTFNLYQAVFDGTAPQQQCGTASNCALSCMSAFPGFGVGITKTATGLEVVRTDPDSWLETTTYLAAGDDPYLKPLFYHPMSYFGGAPGVQFGNPRRAVPCGLIPGTDESLCPGESCSYWNGSSHKRTRLQLRCNNYSDGNTCSSYCGPTLPDPPTIPAL